MTLDTFFPIWNQLTPQEQSLLRQNAVERDLPKGTVLSAGPQDCTGLLAVQSGQLRAFILSEEGREVTIYRLLERDICLFSASCMLQSLQFDVSIEVEKDARLWVIAAEAYQRVMQGSAPLANYTNQLMAMRFSEVMWLMEQILWKSMDKRLAAFLLEESALSGDSCVRLTHEKIAAHLGTAREVVTRMLRYLQGENLVRLARGEVQILHPENLRALAES